MSLTMKMLKTEIDQLATLMVNVFERIEKMEKVGDITSHMVPIQAPVVPVETVEGLENHVPRALLKKMVEVFEANSHKDISNIDINRVLMEMQVEFGRLSIELAKNGGPRNESMDHTALRSYLVDLVNYSVIMWRKLDIIEDDWLD